MRAGGAAGRLLLGRPVSDLVDDRIELSALTTLDGGHLAAEIHRAMQVDPSALASHRQAIGAFERALSRFVPVDAAGRRINAVIDWLRDHREVTRVADVADAFGMTERSLQRLVLDRVGLSPKWLIQRRRLHDAVAELKHGGRTLAELAAELGYADQAHFTNDFRAVVGFTPGHYQTDQP